MEEVPDIGKIKVPRCLKNSPDILSRQLHGFSDASEKAFGAAIYLRVIYGDTTSSVRLVVAKAKVTPIKLVTIPKLE